MFIRYLESYFAEYKAPESKELPTRAQLRDPRYTCRQFIANARAQKSINLLSRVFNQFPFAYKQHVLLDEQTVDAWVSELDTAVRAIDVQETKGELKVTLHADYQNKLAHWVAVLVNQACRELLAEDGKLKPEIVSLLDLHALIDDWKDDAENSANIDLQIVYSYCIQILFGNVLVNWQINQLQSFLAEGGNPCVLGYLTYYISQMFAENTTQKWTPFFRTQCAAYEKSHSIFDRCILKISKTPTETLDQQLSQMLQDEKSDTRIPEATSIEPSSWVRCLELWIDVMHHFKLKNEWERVRAIYHVLTAIMQDMLEYEILYLTEDDLTHYQLSVNANQKYLACKEIVDPTPAVIPEPQSSFFSYFTTSAVSWVNYVGLFKFEQEKTAEALELDKTLRSLP
jgi:hypothetical protein